MPEASCFTVEYNDKCLSNDVTFALIQPVLVCVRHHENTHHAFEVHNLFKVTKLSFIMAFLTTRSSYLILRSRYGPTQFFIYSRASRTLFTNTISIYKKELIGMRSDWTMIDISADRRRLRHRIKSNLYWVRIFDTYQTSETSSWWWQVFHAFSRSIIIKIKNLP